MTICHVPPGNPENLHTVVVAQASLKAHFAHGDFAGACGELEREVSAATAAQIAGTDSAVFTVCDSRTGEVGRWVSLTPSGRPSANRIQCD